MQNNWHTKGSVELLTRTGSIPPIIIVGIESTDRMRDLSPSSSTNNPGSGGGPKFLKFIQDELIPYVDSNYRTHLFRVLEGHSMGGLFTAYCLIQKPELFDAHIIMSPSFWWNEEEMSESAKLFFKSNSELEKAIFFGIGSEDGYGMRQELIRFIEAMKQHQPENLRWQHKEFDGEAHMSAPLLANYYGLKFVFSDMKFPEELINTYSDGEFIKHEKKIMDKYGKEAKQSAEDYVMLAFQLIEENNFSEAITVINRSVEAYSFDVGLLALLASTYEKNKEVENSIETYRKAIEISKKNKFAREEEFKAHITRLKTSYNNK